MGMPRTMGVKAHCSLSETWWNISIVLLVFSSYFYFFSPTPADPDLWGHVRFGQDMLEAGQVIRTDPYSYLTAGVLWINHEWLAEIVMGLAFTAMGPRGLILLKLSVALLTLAILFRYLLRCGVSATGAGVLLLMGALMLGVHLTHVRPQVFTLAFFTLTVVILRIAEEGKPHALWFLVPTFALWINAHGGLLAGLGIVVLWLATQWMQLLGQKNQNLPSRLRHVGTLSAPVVVAICATFITPYGANLLLFLLRTATVARPEILDWQPLTLGSKLGMAYLVVMGITLVGLLYSRRKRSLSQLVVYICACLLPFIAIRHLVLFGIAAIVIAGEHIYDAWSQWSPFGSSIPSTASASRLRPALAGLSALIALVLVLLSFHNTQGISIPKGEYPTRAVALIKASVPQANLAIHFNWGEYAIWHLGPEVKVSIDGRRETVYTGEIYKENLRFTYGTGDWDNLLDERPTDLVLVDKSSAASNLMLLKPGWVKVYEDPLCALFARHNSPLRAVIETAEVPGVPFDGEGMVFP